MLTILWLIFLFKLSTATMVVIPNSANLELTPTLQFRLLDCHGQETFKYADSPKLSGPSSTQILSESQPPIQVSSIEVDRADAGLMVSFYTDYDNEPAFTLSFGMSVYERTFVPAIARSASFGNAHVLASPSTAGQANGVMVRRITITQAPLPYLIL